MLRCYGHSTACQALIEVTRSCLRKSLAPRVLSSVLKWGFGSQLASPEVRTEYRTEPVAVVTANEVDGTPRAMSPVRYMQSVVTPEHSPVSHSSLVFAQWE
eukprot:symbB.v1.2.031755.t1/scaffold3721.1/size51450/2